MNKLFLYKTFIIYNLIKQIKIYIKKNLLFLAGCTELSLAVVEILTSECELILLLLLTVNISHPFELVLFFLKLTLVFSVSKNYFENFRETKHLSICSVK